MQPNNVEVGEEEEGEEDGDGDENEDGNELFNTEDEDKEEDKREGYELLSPLKMTKGDTFALLAAFESGNMDPDPTTLEKVIAMSSGNSIYVASQLLVDPAEWNELTDTSLCRILGNIGRPGIAMLIPPADPMVKQRDSTNWKVINHSPFDGQWIDNFQGTSLHLSFTDYIQPIHTGIHGAKDTEIYFLEALVSVHDGKEWIGDLDIIGSVESAKCNFYQVSSTCRHTAHQLRSFPATSMDNWDEFLDNPNAIFVVRAKENWVARLAASFLSIQRGHRTVVISHKQPLRWPCIRDKFSLSHSTKSFAVIA